MDFACSRTIVEARIASCASDEAPKERVLTTFAHKEPDHVPCWLGASPEWKELARAYLKLEDDEALLRYIGDDFRRVFSTYAGPPERSPDQQLSSPEVAWRSPFAIERHGYGYGIPLTSPLKNATLAEIHAYSWPDPDWMNVSGIKADAARWGGEFAVLGGEWSPFWHDAMDLLDFDVLNTMMPGGGFAASPSHDYLLAETPVENVIIMYETIREFGGYQQRATR